MPTMSSRFFVPEPISQSQVTLRGGEAEHLLRVLRLGAGDLVALFDGSGAEFVARIRCVAAAAVELDVLDRHETDRELPFELVVASAVPKGERFRWMIEKLTELGAARFVPLATARSVVRPRGTVLERMQRVVIEACKQCGRNRLMQIAPLTEWERFLSSVPNTAMRCFGDLSGRPMADWQATARVHSSDLSWIPQVMLAIGPEGGLTAEESAAARAAGWTAVSLGPRTLRVETAAVAWAAALGVAVSFRPDC